MSDSQDELLAPVDLGRAPHCDPGLLFAEIWSTLTDLLGGAATATLVRRSLKRAATRAPSLNHLSVTREHFEYRYALPPEWRQEGEHLPALRALVSELAPLLRELTGPVVLQRLSGHPKLGRWRLFQEQEPRS